jgi:hypothetical protein
MVANVVHSVRKETGGCYQGCRCRGGSAWATGGRDEGATRVKMKDE